MAKQLTEAATIKARVLRLSREMGSLLSDKALPESLRKTIEGFRSSIRKTWKELEDQAGQEGGHKGVASSEADLEEYYTDGEYKWVSPSITSFSQLDTAEAAREIADTMRERVGQFQDMLNNIFFWTPEDFDKVGAAGNLFQEFIEIVGAVLSGEDSDASMMDSAENSQTTTSSTAAASVTLTLGEAETGALSESYEAPITIVEVDAGAAINPRGPLEMDVQLIRPGWGNSRDNHYYPREMLARDAHVFEGAKMYATDHRQDEKSVRTEVSQIKSITGFTAEGAPVGRVVIFDPDFAEQVRNRKKAGVLSSLECSILADGKARPGFEEGGRKGKVVESISAVSSVDWVTRAGAGGKALNLVENEPGVTGTETAPVEETAPETQPVSIREGEETPAEPPEETPAQTEPETTPEAPAESQPAAPVFLGEVEIRAALEKTSLPAASVLALVFGKYETALALQEAIQAEVKRLKEISGSGRPFGLGESAAAPDTSKFVSRASIEETMDKINSKFGIGR